MISGDFNSHYQVTAKSMIKQQLFLGWILSTKYTKELASSLKQDFRAIKEQWTNKTSNVSDLISEPEGEEDVSDTDTDSDITDDEENSSGSAGEESQNFLDNILTAARPWSTNGR